MKRYVLCSFVFVLLYPTAIDLYLVGLPRIADDLGASTSQLHYAFSIYLAGMATTMWVAGKLADVIGRKPVALVTATLFAAASLLATTATEPNTFFLARFAQGIGAGGCYVVAFAVLRDVLDDQQRAKVLSMINGVTCILPVLAPVAGHLIMLHFPWQSLFVVMALLGGAAAMVALLLFKETRPRASVRQPTTTISNTESLRHSQFISRVIISAIAVAVILTYVNVSPMLLMTEMGFSRGQYSLTMTANALLSMTAALLSPLLIARLPARTLILGAQGLFLLASLLLWASLSLAGSELLKLAGFALTCTGFSLGFGVTISQALSPFRHRAGEASSILAVTQICSAALYIWLTGLAGIPPLEMLAGLLAVGGIVSIALINSANRPDAGINDDQAPYPSGS